MQRISLVLIVIALLAVGAAAQVISPSEITDPLGQRLQLQHMHQLEVIGNELRALPHAYHFYFSRKLDIDEKQQMQSDQRSLYFVKREGLSILQVTGNYYIAFPETIAREERARQIFRELVLPMLRIEVAHLANDDSFGGYAFEIAYHVSGKVLGIDSEGTQNFALILPRAAGERLAHAQTEEDEQAALLDGVAYIDAQPFLLWVGKDEPSQDEQARILKESMERRADPEAKAEELTGKPRREVSEKLVPTPEWLKPKPVTAQDLERLNAAYQSKLQEIARGIDPDAHLVAYAPPTFIAFRDTAYIQLSMQTALAATEQGTQYKLAALAFDQHIAHLIRPVLRQLPAEARLAGVDFSTTVRVNDRSESVEFLIPVAAMDCFARYECSGQQIVSSSVILINGERASLDLERAEAER
jgi:hypothetical protein